MVVNRAEELEEDLPVFFGSVAVLEGIDSIKPQKVRGRSDKLARAGRGIEYRITVYILKLVRPKPFKRFLASAGFVRWRSEGSAWMPMIGPADRCKCRYDSLH